ncbi:hypothetical protein PQX77_018607 [Marasmius sp. AFHP31]|nr:hypothetical protein PQX77_018607 [Marasmius sp. AFHP31]
MAEINNIKRQLKIKSGATKRLFKENGLYRNESEDLKRKLDKLIADGVPEDEWEVKNAVGHPAFSTWCLNVFIHLPTCDQRRLCEESNKMIQDTSERLGSNVTDLRELVVAAKKEPSLAEDADLLDAESVLEEASV